MDLSLIIPAFIAGVLTFLAPCTLPLVPAYLGFISGLPVSLLNDPARAGEVRKKVFYNGLFFILGFSLVFIFFGVLAGLLGNALYQYRPLLSRVGGVLVIIFGLFMLGVVKIPFLYKEKRLTLPKIFEPGQKTASLALGASFAFGWTPCIGPILATILFLASSSATALSGGFLLLIFSLGLALPFLIIAIGAGSLLRQLKKINKYLKLVSVIGGSFLIFIGVLMLTNSLGLWVGWFYGLFEFVNYEGILKYL